MKIAVFLPNWLGDLAMATPTLRACGGTSARKRTSWASCGRTWPTCWPAPTGSTSNGSSIRRAKDRSLHGWAVARRMRRQQFDMAVLLTNSLRTAVVAWLGGAEQRIGYVRYGRGPLLTGKLYPRRDQTAGSLPMPMVETYLELAGALGCGEESPRLELATVEADERSADGVFQRLGLRGDGRVCALNSSGAYGGAKLWPVEYFGELARRIVRGTRPRRAGHVRPEGARHRPADRRPGRQSRACSRWPTSRWTWARPRRASAAAG